MQYSTGRLNVKGVGQARNPLSPGQPPPTLSFSGYTAGQRSWLSQLTVARLAPANSFRSWTMLLDGERRLDSLGNSGDYGEDNSFFVWWIVKKNVRCLFLSVLLLALSLPLWADMRVHFIDVGQADAILVECDGENMLVDGGDGSDSSLIYSYLKERKIRRIKYVINTHPHEDHVGGLPGALNYATAERGFSSYSSYDSAAFSDYLRYLAMQNVQLEVLEAGESLALGGATVRVLGPVERDNEVNNNSLVLELRYGEVCFLLTGDVEEEAERRLLEAGLVPDCQVLKVAHHGSDSSSGHRFLRAAAPEHAVISVGKDNGYGHPSERVLGLLEDAGAQVFRTDLHGHVVADCDGSTVKFTVERNARLVTSGRNQSVQKEVERASEYVLNTSSKKFHLPSCSFVRRMSEANKAHRTGTRSRLLEAGYSPCGTCKP